jgi:hypothetical protein
MPRPSADPGLARLLLKILVYTVALLAAAVLGATLILIALDGHPAGLLTVPAGAMIPVILWIGWKLITGPGLLRKRRYPTYLQRKLAVASRAGDIPTATAGLIISLLPEASPRRPTRRDIEIPTATAGLTISLLSEASPRRPTRRDIEIPTATAELTISLLPEAS